MKLYLLNYKTILKVARKIGNKFNKGFGNNYQNENSIYMYMYFKI